MTSRAGRVAARALAIGLPVAAGGLGLALPDDLLGGALAWLGFLLAALAGWGHAVARALRAEVDLGLRLAWGAAALLAVAGVLLAAGVLARPALLGLLALGVTGHAWRHATEAEPVLVGLARRAARLRADPQLAVLWLLLAGLVAVNVLLAAARLHGNPLDDDIAYTPLVRRLLDAGDLDEPFSFRRLSAYGGQTILAALAAARGTLANLYLIDHGGFQLITLALLGGMLRRERAVDGLVAALVLLVVLLMPDASVNTASYWTGAALFLGLYRTAVALDELPRGGAAVLGGLAAAACSLRQNYLPVAVVFVGLVLALRRADRRAWRDAALAGALVLAPYALASWRACATPLYPLVAGTGNPAVPTTATVWSGWQELQFFVRVLLDPNPVRVMVPLVPVALVCRDRRPGRPLLALLLAGALGFALLIHAFTLSDERNLWRYGFGYLTVLALVIAIESSARGLSAPVDDGRVTSPVAARVIVLVCLVLQLAYAGKSTLARYRGLAGDLAEARRGPDRALAARYQRLQAAIPPGAPVIALLDDAAALDYARNPIANLDTPGLASPGPGLPMFAGAEAKAAYLRGQGWRYLAFVQADRSRYFYRRAQWLERLFWESELWRVIAGYQLDLADSLAELAGRYPVRFEEDGLVVLDLGPRAGGPVPGRLADEPAAREAFVAGLAAREGLLDWWRLASRGDVVFEDGWSRPLAIEPVPDQPWTQVSPTTAPTRGLPVRWIGPSAHARVRATPGAAMRVRIWGHVDRARGFTRPRASLRLAGRELGGGLVDEDGDFAIEAVVPAGTTTGWADLVLALSSVGDVWRDPTVARVARVEGLIWEPVR